MYIISSTCIREVSLGCKFIQHFTLSNCRATEMFKTVLPNRLPLSDLLFKGTHGLTRASRIPVRQHAFLGCLAFIVSVSIYDSYLVALYRECILYDERNPICEMLIRKDPNTLSWFMAGKLAGNLGVVGTLVLLRWVGYNRTLMVASGVAAFQLVLLTFLTISDPMTGLLHFDDLFSHNPAKAAKALNSAMLHAVVLSGMIALGVIIGVRWKTIRNSLGSEPLAA